MRFSKEEKYLRQKDKKLKKDVEVKKGISPSIEVIDKILEL
tara:strand:+ start:221 stop:343 length:123 start_codon:yes stop_codon:yes gene_type:complete